MYSRSDHALPDVTVPNPPSDTVSSLNYSPTSDILVACSWDGSVYIYAPSTPGSLENMVLKTSFPNTNSSPVLCSCFSNDGVVLFTGSADGVVRAIDMSSGSFSEIGAHETAVSAMAYTVSNYLVTGGWDKKVKFWDTKQQPMLIKEETLNERVYAIDSKGESVVACLAKNEIVTFNAYNFARVLTPTADSYGSGSFMENKYGMSSSVGMRYGGSSQDSKYVTKLAWQIRSVSCSNDGVIVLLGSLDSKIDMIAVKQVKSADVSNFYTFRSHKTEAALYPINKVLFHPVYQNSFLTCGGDGMYNLWNRESRKRKKTGGPGAGNPITAAAFDKTGRYLAYAVGYDWSKGYIPQINIPVEIKIALISESDHQS